jgi:hypothetical protein
LEAPDHDNRRKATSPNAGERSILTQFHLSPVRSNNFVSFSSMLLQTFDSDQRGRRNQLN